MDNSTRAQSYLALQNVNELHLILEPDNQLTLLLDELLLFRHRGIQLLSR